MLKPFQTDDPREFVLGRAEDGTPLTTYRELQEAHEQGNLVHPPINPDSGTHPSPSRELPARTSIRSPKAPSDPGFWPRTRTGRVVGGPWPSPPSDAPTPETPGSGSWWATTTLGSEQALVSLVESLISGQGLRADRRWVQISRLYREWERGYEAGELPFPSSLNQVLHALDIPASDLVPFIQQGINQLAQSAAQVRMALGAGKIVDAAVQSASDIENGFQDRKLLFEALGLTTRGPLVQVNQANNNTNNIAMAPVAAQPKVLQHLTDVIDAEIREVENSEPIDV